MSQPQLQRKPFSETYRTSRIVQNFNCGDEKWQRELSKWLKRPSGAIAALSHPTRRSDVWLYLTQTEVSEEEELVGFASLGSTIWDLEAPYYGPAPICIIPNLALDRRYWGEPADGLPEDRYSTLIMDDVIVEAEFLWRRLGLEPYLGLYVHPNNTQAKKFYRRMGFNDFDRVSNGNESMIRELPH